MRGSPLVLAGACLMCGCLSLLGGDGVPTPIDAGHDGSSGKAKGAAVTVSSGFSDESWCAVTVSGDVECWGENQLGQLGNGTTTASATPVTVKGLPEAAIQVAVGETTACALTKSGGVFCWGGGENGGLGNGTASCAQTTPVPVTGLESGVMSISNGFAACAVKEDGSVWCWGFGGNGLLGNGQTNDAMVPVPVTDLTSGVTAVSVGEFVACALQRGRVLCWSGEDDHGELGNGTTNASLTPVPVTGLPSDIASVSVGSDFACALTSGGAVKCWGDGTFGALGNDDEAVSPVPVQVAGLTGGVTMISAGYFVGCALEQDGKVVCWGFGADGELGHGPQLPVDGEINGVSTVPVEVLGLSGPATSIAAGSAPCAVMTSGSVECWGITAENALSPVPVTALGSGATHVSVGGGLTSLAFACSVDAMGEVDCWGDNIAGQLGNATTEDSPIPVHNMNIVTGGTSIAAANGGTFACGVDSGLVMCWGNNYYGDLGNGTKTNAPISIPVSVEGLAGVAAVTAGGEFACALTTAGGVYCWGDNTYGELGNGTTADSPVPVAVQGLSSGVVAISAGELSVCAILSNATVDCWGDNAYGQLGNGTMAISTAPAPVPGLDGVTSIGVGWLSACAVTSGGTIACWGDNSYGELGNDTTNSSLVPVPLLSVPSGASRVAVGAATACAIINGGAQCWGSSSGGLGDGLTIGYALTPTPVTGLTSGVTDIACGEATGCAVVHGGVKCWGLNTAGQLGNGGAVDAFRATPVPGFP